MAVYEYTATAQTGDKVSGTYDDVENVAALREELAKMGYVLVKARRAKASARKRKRIKRSEVVAFAYQFAGMYSAGLSILRCLETLEEQAENQAFKNVLTDIRQNVATGSSLRNAFEKYRKDVKELQYPSEEYIAHMREGEFENLVRSYEKK